MYQIKKIQKLDELIDNSLDVDIAKKNNRRLLRVFGWEKI